MVTYPESPVIREHGKTKFDNLMAGSISVNNIKVQEGKVTLTLADGTNSGVDVPVSDMTTADVLISVLSFENAASIATMADRTSEYSVGSGKLVKPAGSDDRNNQLMVIYYKVA